MRMIRMPVLRHFSLLLDIEFNDLEKYLFTSIELSRDVSLR